jgi:hypothetical protein
VPTQITGPLLADKELPTAVGGIRRDCTIIRLFLDTDVRLKRMGGLRYSENDPDSSHSVFEQMVGISLEIRRNQPRLSDL